MGVERESNKGASALGVADKKYAKRTESDAVEMQRTEGIQQAPPTGLEEQGNLALTRPGLFCCIDKVCRHESLRVVVETCRPGCYHVKNMNWT